MGQKYEALLRKVNQLHDLEKAMSVMGWDREVNMPAAGAAIRNQQMTTLRGLLHEMRTSAEMGDLIEAAGAEMAGADYDGTAASLLRWLRRDYAESRLLPDEFVRRRSEVNGAARVAWVKARQEDDFASFAPHLQKVIGLAQELAELYGYEDEPYDALLDKFERGMRTADVRGIFEAVKAETVPLIQAISEKVGAVDDGFLHQPFDVAEQKGFARYVAEAVGYDFARGHLGTAVHPFATSFSNQDARITSRWYPEFLNPSLFGAMHEAGHAIYEQGTGDELRRTPLARGASSGVHESQSRMMENLVGRSRPFWERHYGRLRSHFPQLDGVTVEQFYRAINKVQPSFIRVEADELTYNLHIILRFELEQAMLNGSLTAVDLPGAWAEKMEALLGVVPPNDREGCLQDVHWSGISFGYFPTYALGNLYAAQLLATAKAQDGAIGEGLAHGRVVELKRWLGEHIHRHGRKYDPPELVQRATGQALTHEPFVRYVKQKFGEIYGV